LEDAVTRRNGDRTRKRSKEKGIRIKEQGEGINEQGTRERMIGDGGKGR
jgi:hypothetical protein